MPRLLGRLRVNVGPPPPRGGLRSRKDTRRAGVCLRGTGPTGRPYVVDGASEAECLLEEINHRYWLATGQELEEQKA